MSIVQNPSGDTEDQALVLGKPDDTPPVFVEATGLYMGLLKGRQAWVTGTGVARGVAGGNIVVLGAPIDPDEFKPIKTTVITDHVVTTVGAFQAGGDSNSSGTVTIVEPAPPEFDPADHSVPQVIKHIEEHPDDAEAILEAERSGRARKTILREFE